MVPTFANVVGNGGNANSVIQGRDRLGSQGTKRGREVESQGQFEVVQPRRRRPVNHGSSQVEIQDDGLAAPVEYYIGNTTPAATEEVVQAVLIKCSKGLESQPELQVLKVEQLAKHIENPRTKCWKVIVPYKFKDLMEKDALYPAGLCHRKFFSPRRFGNPAKQPRTDEGIVQEVIKEQQRMEEAKRQEEEDRLRQMTENGLPLATAPVTEDMTA